MRTPQKRMIACLLAAGMVAAMSGCGSSYKSQVEDVDTEIASNYEQSLQVDWTDNEQVNTYIADTKAIYQKLKDLTASNKDSEAQTKINDGADKMLQYLEQLPAYLAISDKTSADAKAKQNELLTLYSAALTSIAEGKDNLGIKQEEQVIAAAADEANAASGAATAPAEGK